MITEMSSLYVWSIILMLGLGTWLIRFSFLGWIGDRPLPLYLKQMLNYASVAVMPGIAAPLVLNTAGEGPDPIRLTAAAVILAVGIVTQNLMKSLLAGMVVYLAGRYLMTVFG